MRRDLGKEGRQLSRVPYVEHFRRRARARALSTLRRVRGQQLVVPDRIVESLPQYRMHVPNRPGRQRRAVAAAFEEQHLVETCQRRRTNSLQRHPSDPRRDVPRDERSIALVSLGLHLQGVRVEPVRQVCRDRDPATGRHIGHGAQPRERCPGRPSRIPPWRTLRPTEAY